MSEELPAELAEALETPDDVTYLRLHEVTSIPPEIGRLRKLRSLSVDAARGATPSIPDELGELTELEDLTIYFPLDAVPPSLAKLPKLKKAWIRLTHPAAGAPLASLLALRDLDVSLQPGEGELEFPSWLLGMSRLERLVMSGRIRSWPEDTGWSELRELDVKFCGAFATLPPAIRKLTRLQKLVIYAHSLPPEIALLRELETLDLGYSDLETLPAEIGQLKKLKSLRIANTALTMLPPELGELAALEQLVLVDNPKLDRLPREIGKLKSLKALSVLQCPVTALPDEIGELESLERFDLGHESRLARGLKRLPASIGRLKKLDTIWATDGHLETLPPEIGECEKLRTLYLRGQKIASIPREIGKLRTLDQLELKDNPLRELPEELLQCVSLRELGLSGCAFPEAAMALIDRLAKLPKMRQLDRPRLAIDRPPPPATASQEPLAQAVLDQVHRHGGRLVPRAEPTPRFQRTKGGRWPMPESMRQIWEEVRWPDDLSLTGKFGHRELRQVRLGFQNDLEEYECTFYHPYIGFGDAGGGNYHLLLDLSDPHPTDPAVYYLDNHHFDEHDVPLIAHRLSEFLSKLK